VEVWWVKGGAVTARDYICSLKMEVKIVSWEKDYFTPTNNISS
jgi:hypothetical protein